MTRSSHAAAGVENPDQELLLLWIVSPAGLVGFFRDTCSPLGLPAKGLTSEQIRAIARKRDAEFRQSTPEAMIFTHRVQ